MRANLVWLIVSVFLTGCTTTQQAAPAEPEKNAKVYYQGKGSERDVRRFRMFLDIALDDRGMAFADSTASADAVVKVQFRQEEGTKTLQAPVVWTTLVSRNGEEYVLRSCNGVSTSTSIYSQPVKYVDAIELPASWKLEHSPFAVYVDDNAFPGFEELLKAVKDRLAQHGYRVVKTRPESDGELKSIKIQKLAIPMRVLYSNRDYEVFDKDSKRFSYTSGKGFDDMTYLGVQPPIKQENLPCRQTLVGFGNNDSQDGFLFDANRIAKAIQEHFSKEAHSN